MMTYCPAWCSNYDCSIYYLY